MGNYSIEHLRIVIVDDSVHMRRIVRSILRHFRCHEIFEAEDGATGLESIELYTPNVLITDLKMPILDGFELIKIVRGSDNMLISQIPIIVLSGQAEKEQVLNSQQAGATSFLRKPVAASAIIQHIVAATTEQPYRLKLSATG